MYSLQEETEFEPTIHGGREVFVEFMDAFPSMIDKSIRELDLDCREVGSDPIPISLKVFVLNIKKVTKLKLRNGFFLQNCIDRQLLDRCTLIRSLSLSMNNK